MQRQKCVLFLSAPKFNFSLRFASVHTVFVGDRTLMSVCVCVFECVLGGACAPMFFYWVLYFFNGDAHTTWKFPGQGLNLSHSCNLHCSCGTSGSLNPLCSARDGTHTFAVTQATALGFLTHCATTGSPFYWVLDSSSQNFCLVLLESPVIQNCRLPDYSSWLKPGQLLG